MTVGCIVHHQSLVVCVVCVSGSLRELTRLVVQSNQLVSVPWQIGSVLVHNTSNSNVMLSGLWANTNRCLWISSAAVYWVLMLLIVILLQLYSAISCCYSHLTGSSSVHDIKSLLFMLLPDRHHICPWLETLYVHLSVLCMCAASVNMIFWKLLDKFPPNLH